MEDFNPNLYYGLISNYGNTSLFTAELAFPQDFQFMRFQKNGYKLKVFDDIEPCSVFINQFNSNNHNFLKHKLQLTAQLNAVDEQFQAYISNL
jgi:hypothetical protein